MWRSDGWGYRARIGLLAAPTLALGLIGCSVPTAEEFLASFRTHQQTPAPATKIDASVAIRVEVVTGRTLGLGPGYPAALRQFLAEDFARLFTRPSLESDRGEDFLLQVSYRTDKFPAFATVKLVDPQNSETLASLSRSEKVESPRIGARIYVQVMGDLQRDLVEAFKQPSVQARLARKGVGVTQMPAPEPRPAPATSLAKGYSASWALVVGINEYRHVEPLNYAVNDARAVAEALPGLGFQHVRLLLDQEATKAAIERVIYDEFNQQMGSNDRLLVFFAGHGVTVRLPRGGEEGYLVPMDGDPKRLALTAIPMDEVRKMGRRVSAKHIFFAIDSCFSGFALTRDITLETISNVDVAAMLQEPVVQVLTAGRRGQKAVEEGGHGLFTRRLLDGLRGLADQERRGFVTVTQLAGWVGPRVARDSEGRQTPQYGVLDGEGDFIFFLLSPRP